jgi:hypothetical protein
MLAGTAIIAPAGPTLAQAAAAATAAAPFSAARPMDGDALAAVTGRADTALEIRAHNSSVVSNNSVSGHSQTGTINFDARAFQNLNGLSLLSANTGNNVSINSSLNVNVAIQR